MSAPSESTVAPRFGTHWRWRAIVALISVAVFVAGWNVARWWRARTIVRWSELPALVRISGPGYESLEQFDQSNGAWRKLAEFSTRNSPAVRSSIQVVLDGKAVAWHQDDRIHIAPTDGSPVQSSAQFKVAERIEFHGLTRNENFALIRDTNEGMAKLKNSMASSSVIYVVDLQSGEIVNSETWVIPSSVGSTGDIVATRISPEEYGHWRFSSEGGWQKTADVEYRLIEGYSVRFMIEPDGQLTWDRSETPRAGKPMTDRWRVTCMSPSGDRFVANQSEGRSAVVDQNTGKVTVLNLPWGSCPFSSFTPNNNSLVISDLLDDIHVLDLTTGRFVAKDSAGSRRRGILFGIVIMGLLLSAAWLRIAFWEQSPHWATLDALSATLAISLALVGTVIAIDHPGIYWNSSRAGEIVRALGYVVMGISAGVALLVAWYWAHGEGSIAARWARGVLLLAIFLPLLPMTEYWPSSWDMAQKLAAAAVFTAGITAMVVSLPNAIGWTIRNRPLESSSPRFGLGAIFAAITSIGMLLALGKWLFSRSQWNVYSPIFAYGIVELMIVSTVMVAILFVRLSWFWIVGALLLIAATVFALNRFGLVGLSAKYAVFLYARTAEGFTLVGMALAVLTSCLVLRYHGFRWTRAVTPLRSPSVVQA